MKGFSIFGGVESSPRWKVPDSLEINSSFADVEILKPNQGSYSYDSVYDRMESIAKEDVSDVEIKFLG